MDNLGLGLLTVVVAALMQGSFAVPMSYAKKWKWENSWMIFAIFGPVVFNLIFAMASVPDLFGVFRATPSGTLVITAAFGLVWGIGAIGFGLGITTVGFGLGYPIMLGTIIGFGSFIPMVILHPEEIATEKGLLVIAGVLITLTGIVLTGIAGIRKEKEQGTNRGEITKNSRFSMKTGIIICFISGLSSSAMNVGFAMGRPIIDAAVSLGAAEKWAGNAIWMVLLSSGAILNIIYCLHLMKKNSSAACYTEKRSFKNLLLILLMSVLWIGSMIFYGVGASMLGSWGTIIGWSVYMILAIPVANFWGIMQGEWKGVSAGTKKTAFAGFCILFLATLIFAYSGTLS